VGISGGLECVCVNQNCPDAKQTWRECEYTCIQQAQGDKSTNAHTSILLLLAFCFSPRHVRALSCWKRSFPRIHRLQQCIFATHSSNCEHAKWAIIKSEVGKWHGRRWGPYAKVNICSSRKVPGGDWSSEPDAPPPHTRRLKAESAGPMMMSISFSSNVFSIPSF